MTPPLYILGRIPSIIHRRYHRYFRNNRELSALVEVDYPAYRPLKKSMEDVLKNNFTPRENKKIEEIEQLRIELSSSPTKINIIDYGAGKPDNTRSDPEVYEGKPVETTIGQVCKTGSKSGRWTRLLFKLIRMSKPSKCLELGTCLGISTAYQATALKMNNEGSLITIEGDRILAEHAAENMQKLGLDDIVDVKTGRFQDILPDILKEQKTFDYVFIDGHHQEKATVKYYEMVDPHLKENAIIVFDDIRWSKGMEKAWEKITADQRIKLDVDLFSVGICVKGEGEKTKVKISLD